MRIGHHEPYDADKGSNRERRAIGAFAKRRDCAIAPRGAGDAKMDACEEDRSEDQVIRRWWQEAGRIRYLTASRLLITADGGGSNGSRVRLWKYELQRLIMEDARAFDVGVSDSKDARESEQDDCA